MNYTIYILMISQTIVTAISYNRCFLMYYILNVMYNTKCTIYIYDVETIL